MELRVEARPGVSLVVSVVPQPALRTPSIAAALVDIYVGYADDEFGKAEYLGSVAPGGEKAFDFNPDRDRDLRLYKISHTVEGIPDVAQMKDAESFLLEVDRTPDAPEISQGIAASNTLVLLNLVANRFVRIVRVAVSDNSDMSDAVETDYDVAKPPDVLRLTRIAAAPTLDKYVTVSVSGGERFSPPSDPLMVTFADISGSGGSSGTGLGPSTDVILVVSEV